MNGVPRVRVGTDVQSIDEVAESLERFGHRYADRLFTAQELATCGPLTRSAAPRLTARFAAKEAVLKLLSPIEPIPRWRSIEVRTLPTGAPELVLHDEAADVARAFRIGPISLSMSHGAGIAMATAVALAAPEEG